jgi:hypothetical protein
VSAGEVATVVSAVVASIALLIAAYQVHSASKNNKETLSKQMFLQVLMFCAENPKFSDPRDLIDENGRIDPAYDAYMSALLFACEEIVDLVPTDRSWKMSIQLNLQDHIAYLTMQMQDERFKQAYSDSLIKLIEEMPKAVVEG